MNAVLKPDAELRQFEQMVNTAFSSVTRLEVIDHTTGGRGGVFSAWSISIELSWQDGGRTLKIFVDDSKENK